MIGKTNKHEEVMKQLHLEPTTRCTLACPRCERTVLINKFGKMFAQTDINIQDLDKFINVPVDTIYMCGNLGDPIYHKDFHKLVSTLRPKTKQIRIVTNGSYRKKKWWKQLSELLEPQDEIEFSIDGTPENFTEYRINGDWPSIQIGINVMVKSNAKTIWKYIPFNYNEDNIEETEQLANELGIDQFIVDPSDRWFGENDPYKTSKLYKFRYRKHYHNVNEPVVVKPKCIDFDNHHFVSADGYYTPCCYVKHHSFYYSSEWNNSKHDIRNTALNKELQYFWQEFSNTVHDQNYCKFFCGKG